jgi:feruloyl esterase
MFLLLFFYQLVTCSAADHFQTACSALRQNINLPNVTVNFAEFVPGKSNVSLIDNPVSCGSSYQTLYGGDICRVAMSITTSNQSGLTAEMWLPRDYTGRFLSTGNGGLAGCIHTFLTFRHLGLFIC